MIIVLFVIWLIFSLFEGIREALSDTNGYYWKYKHILYTIQRCLMAAVSVTTVYIYDNWWTSVILGIALIGGFSFLHNGFYCIWRNKFAHKKIYPRGFFDRGSTAIFEFNFVTRLIMFIFALFITGCITFIKYT